VLHLNVSKVDMTLHMGYAWEVGGGASGSVRSLAARATTEAQAHMGEQNVSAGARHAGANKGNGVRCGCLDVCVRPDVRPLALP
jgi:hypothetical protein